jgi:Na+/H+ antiporter NhaD/arsenite permease-like protein
MIAGFLFIPSDILSIDLIALISAIVMLILSKLNPKDIFEKCDWEIVLFILGVSVIVGGMDKVGIISQLGNWLLLLSNNQVFPTYMIVLWMSGIFSAGVDDISITKVMIPVVDVMTRSFTPVTRKFAFYTLNWGINLGDNLLPLGDTIMVFNIAKNNDCDLTFKQYIKYGVITGFYNLGIISVYIAFLFNPLYGFIFLALLILCVGLGLYPRIKKIITKRKLKSPQIETKMLPSTPMEDYKLPKTKEKLLPPENEEDSISKPTDRDFD